jgi:hypothetical protein
MTRISIGTLALYALSMVASPAVGQATFGFDPVKTCDVSMHGSGGAYVLDCTVTIDHPMGPPVSPMGNPVTLGVIDILSQNGQPVPNASFGFDPASGFNCVDGSFPITSSNGMSQNQPPTYTGFGCSIGSDQVPSATQTTLTLQTQVSVETTGIVTNCVHSTMWDPSLPDGVTAGPQACIDIDLDAIIAPPDLPPTVEKTCDTPVTQADGSITVACWVTADFPSGASFMAGEAGNLPIHIVDTLTLNGAVLPGATSLTTAYEPWTCTEGPFSHFPEDQDQTPRMVCTLGGQDAYLAATSGAGGRAGSSTIIMTSTFPPGSTGTAENCAYMAHFLIPDAAMTTEPACATIDLGGGNIDTTFAPVACEAFTPEVTCNKVTGKPIVTLKNKYASLFRPKSVAITSLTPGVTVLQSTANPLSVQLTGAAPGDTISLSTEAMEKGAGSEPGLDLCCMGEIEVTIPEGFICEAEQVLEVSKTCDTGINPAIDTDADCEITVHYEGPPPSASNPIKIVEAVTGNPWAFSTTPLSGDNWNCPAVPDATPFTCTISAADEPGANWQNWTSTLIVQMSVGEKFENCVTATAAGGLEDKVCWSTETPKLTIEKMADQEQCVAGQPCTFTITVSNPSGVDYTGPISINDHIVGASPPVLSGNGTFTSISPALCSTADLNAGLCTGQASIPAGGGQSYSVTWMPPVLIAGVEADEVLVTNCVSGANAAGTMGITGAPDPENGDIDLESCATVTLLDPEIDIVKTGPKLCLPGQPCEYQVTLSAGAGGFNGPILLADQAPAGFQVTSIMPTPIGCGANLPADNLACVVPVSLNAGDTVSYTIAITPMGNTLDTDYFGENCALLGSVSEGSGPADYSFSGQDMSEELTGLLNATTMLGEACAPVVWNPDEGGSVEIVKDCAPLAQEDSPVLSYAMACTITANVTGQFSGQVSVTDVFQPAASGSGTVGPMTPISGNWACTGPTCQFGPAGPGSYQLGVTVTGIRLDQDETVTNCANSYEVPVSDGVNTPLPVVNESCVTLTPPVIGDPDDTAPPPTITKTCSAPVAGPFGLTSDCTIVVTSNANPQPYYLTVTETLGQYLDASDTGASITGFAYADPWTVSSQTPIPPATPVTLTLMGSDMPASGQSTITATVQLMNEGYLMETENCATVQAYTAANQPIGAPQNACADFNPPSGNKVIPTGSPALSVTKTATGPCVPDVAAQTYACGFDLTVTNSGTAAFAGPMVVGDAFDPGMVTAVNTNGAGWSCNLAGDAASCINGNLSLAPGASSSVALDVTVQGQPEGGTFTNCGSIGASDDPTAQAMIVQTALTLMGVDIGAVDGKPGKRTRAAVADLQKQLGLEATGEIDGALLSALGVPMARQAEKSCVTVDLPQMPRPPLQCEKATTKLVEGACACRFKNMYQADKTSCGCVKGTKFVAGEGCIKTRDKPKEDTPKALKCDPNSTVLRNGKCQCREEGMEKISKTACAKPKKKQPDLRICPNGLPEIPGIGCVEFKREKRACEPALEDCP